MSQKLTMCIGNSIRVKEFKPQQYSVNSHDALAFRLRLSPIFLLSLKHTGAKKVEPPVEPISRCGTKRVETARQAK